MRKASENERVLARVLAEELKKVQGGDTVVATQKGAKKDITDTNNGDTPDI